MVAPEVAENDWEVFRSSLSALAVRNTKLKVLSLLTEPCVKYGWTILDFVTHKRVIRLVHLADLFSLHVSHNARLN